ncbi:hypothetical protein GCM10028798_34110 [Humibacter antri]
MTDTAVPIQHRLLITVEVAVRYSRAVSRYALFRPRRVVLAVMIEAGFVFAGMGASANTGTPVTLLCYVLAGAVLVVGYNASLYAFVAWSVRNQLPIGEEWGTGFGAEKMREEIARRTSQTVYSVFTRMTVRDGVVILQRRTSRSPIVLPVELVPADAQQLLAARLSK